jgi:hypothetical protein
MKLFVAILYFVMAIRLNAQEYPRGAVDISHIADEIYGLPDTDLNYEELYENLVQLLASPLNLNKATREDLQFLKILSESQINSILTHRMENGNFISVYELQGVPELDLYTLYKLAPLVTVIDQTTKIDRSLWYRMKKESENYFLLRYERTMEIKKGFDDTAEETSRFKGSPDKLYMRFRSSRPGDFSLGFTAEKDPGEQIKWSPSTRYYGADYFSYHVQIQNKGRLKNLILGDYQGQLGQGLMFGGLFGMGKGGETITTVRRSNIGFLPYTSVYEAGAMRGIGITIQASNRISATGFFSNIKKDVTIDSLGQTDIISSFQTSGLHRNESELAKRKKIGEKNFGGIVQYKHNAMDAGIMFNQMEFDAPVLRKPTAYNQFTFSGKVNQNVGLYFNHNIRNISFFSEVAHSLKGGFAGSAGVLTSLSPKLDVSLLYRKYDRNFYSFYSSGFGESNNTQNEQGIYWGWKYTFNRRYSTSGYFDLFKFPWLRFRNYAPSTGYEWLLRFNYEPSRKVKIFFQLREESKNRNVEADSINQYSIASGKKKNYWLSFDYTPHTMLRLKSRVQRSSYTINENTTHGFALMQDLIVDIGKLKFTLRYALFETEDYDNRQYAYENDVWLAYSLPAYYGSGVRKMAILEYKINKHIIFWIRYAHIRYQHQDYIGTSLDRIDGDRKNDVKAQVVVRF